MGRSGLPEASGKPAGGRARVGSGSGRTTFSKNARDAFPGLPRAWGGLGALGGPGGPMGALGPMGPYGALWAPWSPTWTHSVGPYWALGPARSAIGSHIIHLRY